MTSSWGVLAEDSPRYPFGDSAYATPKSGIVSSCCLIPVALHNYLVLLAKYSSFFFFILATSPQHDLSTTQLDPKTKNLSPTPLEWHKARKPIARRKAHVMMATQAEHEHPPFYFGVYLNCDRTIPLTNTLIYPFKFAYPHSNDVAFFFFLLFSFLLFPRLSMSDYRH